MLHIIEIFSAIFVLLSMSLPILYDEGPSYIKYFIKITVFYTFLTVYSILLLPYMALRPGNPENMTLAAHIMRPVSKLLGIRWHLVGAETLKSQKSCVVVVNHQHSIDLLGLFEMWPLLGKCRALAKKELLFTGPFGMAALLGGTIFIDRANQKVSCKFCSPLRSTWRRIYAELFPWFGSMTYLTMLAKVHVQLNL